MPFPPGSLLCFPFRLSQIRVPSSGPTGLEVFLSGSVPPRLEASRGHRPCSQVSTDRLNSLGSHAGHLIRYENGSRFVRFQIGSSSVLCDVGTALPTSETRFPQLQCTQVGMLLIQPLLMAIGAQSTCAASSLEVSTGPSAGPAVWPHGL